MGKSARLPAAAVVWGLCSLLHTIKALEMQGKPGDKVLVWSFSGVAVSHSHTNSACESPSSAVNSLYLDDFPFCLLPRPGQGYGGFPLGHFCPLGLVPS